GDCGSRVIQVLRLDQDFADAEETFFKLGVMDAAPEVLQLHRKVRILHLAGKRVFETALKCGRAVDVQLISWEKGRSEKRKSLNVVPMRVADQQMDSLRSGARQHVQSEQSNTRS